MLNLKKGFLERPMFYVFILLFILSFAVCELLSSSRRGGEKTELKAGGEVYREPWNSEDSFIFETNIDGEKAKILISGKSLDDTYIDKLLNYGFAELEGMIAVPETAGNFKEFDYFKYLKTRGVDYCAFPDKDHIRAAERQGVPHGLNFYSASVREDIGNCLEKYLGKKYGGWVLSVMTGDTGGLESYDKERLSLAGFSHIVAVSGSHISFFTAPFEMLLKKLKKEKSFKKVVLLLPVMFLWFIAGNSPSVFRAIMMAVIGTVACVARKNYDRANALGISGVIQLFINPFSVFSTGFILSYLAVVAIIFILPALKKRLCIKTGLLDSLLVGLSVNLGLLPVLLYIFNGFSVVGMIANVVASWVANFLCVSGYVIYALDKLIFSNTIIGILSKALTGAAGIFCGMADKVASGDGWLFRFEAASPELMFFVVYYLILILFLTGRRSYKFAGIVGACVLVAFMIRGRTQLELVFFDVGQGSSSLVKVDGNISGVVDTGDGGVLLSDLILKEGIKKLDFLVLSHGHNDHYGGLRDILDNIDVDRIFLPTNRYDVYCSELSSILQDTRTEVINVNGFMSYKLGKTATLKLYESKKDQANLNNGSVVAAIEGDFGKVLLPGDVEDEVLNELVDNGCIDRTTMLCLPHHGSVSSGSEKFLFSAQPKYVIISAGIDNMYGHPSEIVLDRLMRLGIESQDIYRTDEGGAIRVRFGKRLLESWEFVYICQKRMRLSQLLQI